MAGINGDWYEALTIISDCHRGISYKTDLSAGKGYLQRVSPDPA